MQVSSLSYPFPNAIILKLFFSLDLAAWPCYSDGGLQFLASSSGRNSLQHVLSSGSYPAACDSLLSAPMATSSAGDIHTCRHTHTKYMVRNNQTSSYLGLKSFYFNGDRILL